MRLLSHQKKNNRQMALSSVSSLVCKNKYMCLARVEGETLRWRTTDSVLQKKKHAAGACTERRPPEKTTNAKRLELRKLFLHAPPAVESVSPALLGTMATLLPSAIMCSCVRRLLFFGGHERGAIKVFGACTSRTFLNLLVDPTSAHGSSNAVLPQGLGSWKLTSHSVKKRLLFQAHTSKVAAVRIKPWSCWCCVESCTAPICNFSRSFLCWQPL